MRILLNGLPIWRGGGLQNLRNLWRMAGARGGDHTWLAVARPEHGLADVAAGGHLEVRVRPVAGFADRLRAENLDLPALARRWGADVVFTPMGAGPLRSPVPTVVGWHDSVAAYPDAEPWRRMGWRERTRERLRSAYAGVAVRRAARVCVQTSTMARRVGRLWGIPEDRFRVIPNSPSTFLAGQAPAGERAPGPPWTLLVVAEPQPAKNLEVLPAVAAELGRAGWDAELVVTVGDDGDRYLEPLNRAQAEASPGIPLRRVGRVPHDRLSDLYRGAAVVLLPSLVESFSAVYLEAMHFGVPLVTSDRDFARELCGEAALYADPTDPVALAEAVGTVLSRPDVRARLRARGRERLEGYPSWPERFDRYRRVLEEVGSRALG